MGNTVDCEEKETIPFDSFYNDKLSSNEVVIESKTRIPQSRMWDLQHQFYSNASSRDWSYRKISLGISSSSFLAKSYANLIISYMHDRHKQFPIDSDHKLVILDFGAGHGRLCYLMIHHLLKQRHLWPDQEECPFQFVMTDCSQKIINWWKRNEYLKPYMDQGYLDVCLYDVETMGNFYLQIAGKELKPDDFKHPPFVILNNVLSCLRQDVVRLSPKGLIPGTVSLFSSQHEYFPNDPVIIPRLSFKWQFDGNVQNEGWEQEINQIMSNYKSTYNYGTFIIPTHGIALINKFLELFQQQCILCIGDEGVYLKDEIQAVKDPSIRLNGDIHLPINFDFFDQHVHLHDGWTLSSPLHEDFRILFCCYGLPMKQYQQLRLSYHRFFVVQSWDMVHSISTDITRSTTVSLQLIVRLLRLTQFDHDFLLQAKQSLQNVNKSQVLSRINIHDLVIDLDYAKYDIFPIQISHDTCFDIARMYMLVQQYQTAADLFLLSTQLYGEHHASWFNRGVCLYRLNKTAQARFCFYRTLELNYEYEDARRYLNRIYNNCPYTGVVIPHFNETPIEEDKVDFTDQEKEEEVLHTNVAVVDEIELSLSSEGSVVSEREEEYITIEGEDHEEYVVERFIPGKEDDIVENHIPGKEDDGTYNSILSEVVG